MLVAILQYWGNLLEEASPDLNAQCCVHGLSLVVAGPDDVAALAPVGNASRYLRCFAASWDG